MPGQAAEASCGLCEISGRILCKNSTRQGTSQGAEHPADYNRITDRNTQGTHKGNPSKKTSDGAFASVGPAKLIRPKGSCLCLSSDGKLRRQAGQAEQADKKEIRDQECRPSELAQTIWEHPYVAKAHRRTHTGQNKAE